MVAQVTAGKGTHAELDTTNRRPWFAGAAPGGN